MERIQKTEFRSEHRLQIRFAMLSESNVRPHFKQALGVVVLISGVIRTTTARGNRPIPPITNPNPKNHPARYVHLSQNF